MPTKRAPPFSVSAGYTGEWQGLCRTHSPHDNTAVQQTSAAAYAGLTDLGDRQAAVHDAIKALGSACNQQIADHLNLPVNQITGRVFELRKLGLVRESHKAVWMPTGRRVIFWTSV